MLRMVDPAAERRLLARREYHIKIGKYHINPTIPGYPLPDLNCFQTRREGGNTTPIKAQFLFDQQDFISVNNKGIHIDRYTYIYIYR
jgi:hypothetical protein